MGAGRYLPVEYYFHSIMLELLFTSRTRVQLLELFLLHPEQEIHVREICRITDLDINAVRREFANWKIWAPSGAGGRGCPVLHGEHQMPDLSGTYPDNLENRGWF